MESIDIVLSLLALIALEITLGIDNLVFLSILTEKIPTKQRKKARQWGLLFAWVARLVLLALSVFLVKLTTPLMTIAGLSFSIRDFFLLAGGGFLIAKATQEIHDEVSDDAEVNQSSSPKRMLSFKRVTVQVALMDVIFSLDSVLTAVGLTSHFFVMAIAITCAILVMLYASEPVYRLIQNYPSLKMLALSFLMLIGMVLIADGFSFHVPRGYIYVAMGFSLMVEGLNLLKRGHRNKRKAKVRAL